MAPQLEAAVRAALTIPFGSSTHKAAMGLCVLRGLDPNEAMHVPGFETADPVLRWHLLVADEIVSVQLRRTIAA